jgi:hypothetical protein
MLAASFLERILRRQLNMSLESVTAEWMENLAKVQGLVLMAQYPFLRPGYVDAVMALHDAMDGGLMYGDAAVAGLAVELGLPAITVVYVYVALGSGYYQAREEAKEENNKQGFAQGFVTGILGWKWIDVIYRFRRPYLRINHFDEEMDSIRVNSFHSGLLKGYVAGRAFPTDGKKAYSKKIRKLGNVHGPKEWSQDYYTALNQQSTYVIEMASAALNFQIIQVG